jgi:peroxiredoxin
LAAALLLAAPQARATDWFPYWPWSGSVPEDPKMAAIVAAVRAEEARYQDVEYVARITVRDVQRKDRAAPSDITTMARRHVVFQGGRTFFRHEAFERVGAVKYRHEETSAYDGERTRTVVGGNCVNIHLGRWQHPQVFPAHTLPLAHYGVNFPLSVYLCGTAAIHAHLGYPLGLVGMVPWQTFRKVEVHFEGEEVLDGLRCLKVRADRWYQPNQPPATQSLWLAPERNYHCIKEEHPHGVQRYEMRVHELREVSPGVWFPARISVVLSQANAPPQRNAPPQKMAAFQNAIQKKASPQKNASPQNDPFVISRTEMTIEEVSLAPHHDAAFFRDVAIPAGLPVFTIKDRTLVGSMLPEPVGDDRSKKNLAELARRVGEQENRYNDIEVKARTVWTYPRTSSSVQNARNDQMSEERSIQQGDRAYSITRQKFAGPGGWQDAVVQINAYDGEWSRWLYLQGTPAAPPGIRATLRRGCQKTARGLLIGFPLHRPHTLILRNSGGTGSLADMLDASPEDAQSRSLFDARYCGAVEVDGRPCIQVRADPMQGRNFNRNAALVLYLATDRNDIPIRIETYGNFYGQRQMPTAVSHSGDFREIAPGLWYPFRLTEFYFDIWALAGPGWILLNSRRDITIESVTSPSRVSDAVFRDVTVPAGAVMQVCDESGQYIGQVQQPEDGVPWLSLKRYLELSSGAQVQPQIRQMRKQALDALIGRPAPEFPRRATWLNGKPMTAESLRGRIVVLGFWAEWDEACRDDLVRLNQIHRDGAKDGLTVVGVHPPGSQPVEIASVIDALKLDFPTCVDATAAEGANAWGEFSSLLAVRSVPYAVVVDGEGKIVAVGRLDDVLDKARALIKKGR